jgi:hypothetical protein
MLRAGKRTGKADSDISLTATRCNDLLRLVARSSAERYQRNATPMVGPLKFRLSTWEPDLKL